MDIASLLARMEADPSYAGQLSHVEVLPERPGQFAEPDEHLPETVRRLLAARGIERLYSHQAAAYDAARRQQDLVAVTGTASGKTLCYNLPILAECLADRQARALYLFPTKALAQDQLKGLLELLAGDAEAAGAIKPGVFDGDTPTAQRRRIKAEANLVLSNPDMLHASILPYHPKWSRFFSELRYVVLDEVHMYRGILGANVACVLRRLLRVCEHYGSRPVFLCASATVANPGELASRLVGRPVQVIDNDGAPRGRKYFALWNPTPLGRDSLARRSAADDAVWWMREAMRGDLQSLAFTRTRQATELINRYVQESFARENSPLAKRMRAYRGGYLPNERRQIEQDLFSGELRGVAATNALELGVDIGSLDVVLLVQYPGTIASAWQQAGRSGRRQTESLAVLLAGNDPIDQYLLRNPGYFFAQSPEHAVVDPENPYVLAKHLKAAAFELPLDDAAVDRFGPLAAPIAEVLTDAGDVSKVAGRFYFSGGQNPAQKISLRHMSDETFSIILCPNHQESPKRSAPIDDPAERKHPGPEPHANHVIANVDAISAPELIYPEAVYLHNGETYFVRDLDLENKVAYVERHEMDYYTQAVLESNVKITGERYSTDSLPTCQLAFGDVDVSWKTVAFKKIKFGTRENVGYGQVDIPEQRLPTTAFWLSPHDGVRQQLKQAGHRASEANAGLRNLAVVALPMIAMCDSRDVSGVVDSQNLGVSSVIMYDRYPGGLGYCEKGCQYIGQLLQLCYEMVQGCECEEGCPSCVGLPNLRPAIHSDPDLTRGYPIPDKAATLRLLELLLRINATATPNVLAESQ
ncbi:MAG: DEAD/DEAH box helicase [Planctomycetales bacterium]|nr:DEAD/DEAH box helicase [Planctomycetales bacterium]